MAQLRKRVVRVRASNGSDSPLGLQSVARDKHESSYHPWVSFRTLQAIGDLARFLKQPHTAHLHDGRLWECGMAIHLTVVGATKGKWWHL